MWKKRGSAVLFLFVLVSLIFVMGSCGNASTRAQLKNERSIQKELKAKKRANRKKNSKKARYGKTKERLKKVKLKRAQRKKGNKGCNSKYVTGVRASLEKSTNSGISEDSIFPETVGFKGMEYLEAHTTRKAARQKAYQLRSCSYRSNTPTYGKGCTNRSGNKNYCGCAYCCASSPSCGCCASVEDCDCCYYYNGSNDCCNSNNCGECGCCCQGSSFGCCAVSCCSACCPYNGPAKTKVNTSRYAFYKNGTSTSSSSQKPNRYSCRYRSKSNCCSACNVNPCGGNNVCSKDKCKCYNCGAFQGVCCGCCPVCPCATSQNLRQKPRASRAIARSQRAHRSVARSNR